ncbi:MAG: HAMP domain-containing histidine kinase [Nitrospinae bacterium]|nr:HAMP domain-containing histidine kinase [Nitrospinota bacterium]
MTDQKEPSAEEKLRMQGDLVNMMVHDLKGPLMEVIANIDLIQNSPAIGADEKDFAQTAMEGCNNLFDTISDMLDLGKLEAGMLKPSKTPCDLAEMVEKELKKVRVTAEDRNVKVRFEKGTKVEVLADEKLLRRVVANLVSNGLKFSPPGKTLTVSLAEEEGNARLTVKDEGPGVPPGYREQIFDKYVQVELRSHRQPGGTGLGLTFCKMAVEAHGGKIGLNNVSQGSEFYFVIPNNG